MSTFDGIVEEFPSIRIDYFRKNPDRPAPLAGFLSHVHSDHLQGLESWRAPFIYCSSPTREILLRLEKYPHRMNFSKGILESRKQHYKHLAKILRPIPLNTPTEIELTPRIRIRVTLLDANHCIGAVMFLVEGRGKSILYTGDIRAESWWINQLARNPVLIPYTSNFKHLDKLYLDTTFAVKSRLYATFPPKAEGIKELLEKIAVYPADTIFYFRAWTFGYEDVWQALAAALRTTVHLDRYQIGLYEPLAASASVADIGDNYSFLCGFRLGNKFVPGCLSANEDSRIHSCEPGMLCPVVASGKAVYITPIVNRLRDGSEMLELGAGGGGGDLYQNHELELPDQFTVAQLENLCVERISDDVALSEAKESILEAFKSKKSLSLGDYGLREESEISLSELIEALQHGRQRDNVQFPANKSKTDADSINTLPRAIRFPYSRHSSYAELCELVSLFKPKDLHPCTVDIQNWNETLSMESLFGHLCSARDFTHDRFMRDLRDQIENEERPNKRMRSSSPTTTSDTTSSFRIEMQQASQAELRLSQLDGKETETSGQNQQSDPLPSIHRTSSPACDSYSQEEQDKEKEPEAEAQELRDMDDRVRSLRNHLIEMQDEARFTIAPLPSHLELYHGHQHQILNLQAELVEHNEDNADHDFLGHPSSPTTPSPTSISKTVEFASEPESSQPSFGSRSDEEGSITVSSYLSRKRRLMAYQAAKAGTYDAWSEFALISAGNGHTEPEIEL